MADFLSYMYMFLRVFDSLVGGLAYDVMKFDLKSRANVYDIESIDSYHVLFVPYYVPQIVLTQQRSVERKSTINKSMHSYSYYYYCYYYYIRLKIITVFRVSHVQDVYYIGIQVLEYPALAGALVL